MIYISILLYILYLFFSQINNATFNLNLFFN